MSPISKVFVVLNLVFSLVVLGAVCAILAKGESFKDKLAEANQQIAQLKTEKEDLQRDFAAARANFDTTLADRADTIATLETQNQTKDARIEQLNRDNDQMRTDLDSIAATLKDFRENIDNLQTRNSQLSDQVAQLRQENADAVAKQRQAEDDLANAERQLGDANSQIAALEKQGAETATKLADREATIEAIARSGYDVSALVSQPPIDAVVQAVDQDAKLVVLSKGSDDGVKKGFKFSVYRDDKYVGEVVVIEVNPDNAVARIQLRNDTFRELDKATTTL
ncbi:MAG: hypothetical protein AB1486_20465 [Planctomycetota bacterium]